VLASSKHQQDKGTIKGHNHHK